MQETDYAGQLGDQLEIILGQGADTLEAVVERLNQSSLKPPSNEAWTPDVLVAELRRFGD